MNEDTFRYQRWFWILVGVHALFRLGYTLLGPLDLAADEAYYWTWSRVLDWNYYSKGPLIAYIMAFGTALAGNTELGIRWPTLVFSLLTVGFAKALYEKLFPERPEGILWLALLYCCAPVLMVGGILSTIDPPFVTCWVIGTYALYAAVQEEKRGYWVLVALAFGVGILAKYTMLLFLFAIVSYAILAPKPRPEWKQPWVYAAVLGGLCFLLPSVLWNMANGWVTWGHNMDLARASAPIPWGRNVFYSIDMVLVQMGILSPGIFLTMALGGWMCIRQTWQSRSGPWLVLFCSFAPILLFYLLLTIKRPINPNWVVATYPALLIAGAYVAAGLWQTVALRNWMRGGLALGLVMCTIILFSDGMHASGLPNSASIDPAARLKGWSEMAQAAHDVRSERSGGEPVFFFGHRYQSSSQLAFYLPDQPQTYCAPDKPLSNQYDVWGGSSTRVGQNGIYARLDKPGDNRPLHEHIADSFETTTLAHEEVVTRFGVPIRVIRIWWCEGFRGWAIPTELERVSS